MIEGAIAALQSRHPGERAAPPSGQATSHRRLSKRRPSVVLEFSVHVASDQLHQLSTRSDFLQFRLCDHAGKPSAAQFSMESSSLLIDGSSGFFSGRLTAEESRKVKVVREVACRLEELRQNPFHDSFLFSAILHTAFRWITIHRHVTLVACVVASLT